MTESAPIGHGWARAQISDALADGRRKAARPQLAVRPMPLGALTLPHGRAYRLGPEDILGLQRTVGNQVAQRLCGRDATPATRPVPRSAIR